MRKQGGIIMKKIIWLIKREVVLRKLIKSIKRNLKGVENENVFTVKFTKDTKENIRIARQYYEKL